jgi:ethanolamine utilization protein EutP (predicted NTPase)
MPPNTQDMDKAKDARWLLDVISIAEHTATFLQSFKSKRFGLLTKTDRKELDEITQALQLLNKEGRFVMIWFWLSVTML